LRETYVCPGARDAYLWADMMIRSQAWWSTRKVQRLFLYGSTFPDSFSGMGSALHPTFVHKGGWWYSPRPCESMGLRV